MKLTLSILLFLLSFHVSAQNLAELQRALKSSDKTDQAIHGYPAHIYEGKCHWVPVTAIELSGSDLIITETWNGPMGRSQTVLSGSYINGLVKGNWASGFSSGTWSYSFASGKGLWNKTKSITEIFKDLYPLKFRIVNKQDLKDGPYVCK